ncbi:MAG TPA: KorB domain-containing protein [Bryobacteraceae bacterium]|nr:KorB domain-containing protein [Bryobacteraceae bacterium]
MALKLSVETHGKRDEYGFDPFDLIPNFSPFTGRKERSEEAIQAMAESLLKHGQQQAFLYRKGYDGKPIPVSGHTRILAAARITERCMTGPTGVTYSPESPFIIFGTYRQMNEVEAVIHTFVENDDPTRTPLNSVDHALLIRVLSESHGLKDSEIAARLGKDPSWVAKHKKVLELDAGTQAMVASDTLSLDAAVTVVAAIEPSQRAEVIERAKEQNNGRATSPAITRAATEMGATTAGSLKRTDAQFKEWLKEKADQYSAGPAQKFFFGVLDWRLGKISDADLDQLLKDAVKR